MAYPINLWLIDPVTKSYPWDNPPSIRKLGAPWQKRKWRNRGPILPRLWKYSTFGTSCHTLWQKCKGFHLEICQIQGPTRKSAKISQGLIDQPPVSVFRISETHRIPYQRQPRLPSKRSTRHLLRVERMLLRRRLGSCDPRISDARVEMLNPSIGWSSFDWNGTFGGSQFIP